jgi:hypothetical protein
MEGSMTFLGVPVRLRPIAAVAGLLNLVLIGLITRDAKLALAAAGLWYTADAAHVAGHIASSHLAGAPLDAVDFGLYPMSVYHDHDVTPQQHIGRASGGVGTSLVLAILLALVVRLLGEGQGHRLARVAAAQHAFLAAASLLPIRMVDGGIIYTNLLKIAQGQR